MAFADVLVWIDGLYSSVSPWLNVFVVAVTILLIGFILGRIVESALRHAFSRLGFDDRMTKLWGVRRQYSRATRRTIVRIIYLITIVLALDYLAMLQAALILLILIVLLLLAVSLVLALLDIAPNLAARGQLLARGIRVGDDVAIADDFGIVEGLVQDISLIDTRIARKNGDVFFVPNAAFLRQAVVRKRKQ
jgi:small-conductance mechanosensitive channel